MEVIKNKKLKSYFLIMVFKKTSKVMKKIVIISGLIMFLVGMQQSCFLIPLECAGISHGINNKINITPSKDTLKIGDTLKFRTAIKNYYVAENGKEYSINEKIEITTSLFDYQNNEDGSSHFRYKLNNGKKDDAIINKFYFEQVGDEYVFDIEIIAQKTGSYALELFTPTSEINHRDCYSNYSIFYTYEVPETNTINNYFIENIENFSFYKPYEFYAFVVTE